MSLFNDIDQLAGMRNLGGSLPPASEVARVREIVQSRLRQSTVLRQYLVHTAPGREARNTQPWHAEGERQYAALLLSAAGVQDGPTVWMGDGNEPVSTDVGNAMAIGASVFALGAAVYLWKADIEDLADAAPLPRHTVSRDCMPHAAMFWSRDVARFSVGWNGQENNWMLVLYTPTCIRVFGDRSSPDGSGGSRIVVGEVPFGLTYPDDFGESAPSIAPILARLAFLNSPYVSPEHGRLPRPWRREMERRGAPPELSDPRINVVQLRRDARENVDRERQETAGSVERKSHWWVSGHYRAQWYPSKDAHEVIWIAPYLKGDLSKPLAPKVYAVVR